VLFENPIEKLKTKCPKDDQLFVCHPKDDQLLVCQPTGGQDSHLGSPIYSKSNSTLSGPHTEHLCAKFGVDSCSRSWEEDENVSANLRTGWPYWILNPLKVTTLGRDSIRNICVTTLE